MRKQVTQLHEQCLIPRTVYLNETVAIKKGQGLCYQHDAALTGYAVTVETPARGNVVKLPDGQPASGIPNNFHFAGVAAMDYAAGSALRPITIYEPGSICHVLAGIDTTAHQTIMCCSAQADCNPGHFTQEGALLGDARGYARALTTQTNLKASDYTATATLDATGLILTDSGATFSTNGVVAGDKVYIVAGENDGTNAVTAGEYTVSSVDSETQLTLTAAAADGGTMEVSYYIQADNPLVLAKLLDGPESGLLEWFTPANGAQTAIMIGGMTHLHGGFTPSADSTYTLADGAAYNHGGWEAFVLHGALGTNDFLMTLTNGKQIDQSTQMQTAELDGDGDTLYLQWFESEWYCRHYVGTAFT